jgi:hypothetical protein
LETGYVWIEFVCPFRILLGRDIGFIECDMVALVVEFVLQATDVAVRVAGGVKGGRGACDLCLQRRDLGGMVIDFRAALLDFDKVPAAHCFDVPVGGIGEAPLLDGDHAICVLCVFVDSAFLALWCRLLCYNCLLLCCCAAESGLLLGARRRWLWRDFECSVVTGAQTEVSALCRAWWLVAALRQRLPVIVIAILFIILDGGSADETRRRKER